MYEGTKFAYLDEPRTVNGPFCKDCANFIPEGEKCKQATLADFVNGTLIYRDAQDVRYGDAKLGLNCGHEGLWFISRVSTPP